MKMLARRSIAGAASVLLLSGAYIAPAPVRASSVPATVFEFDGPVREASLRFGIPEHWIRAVMRVESAGARQATSVAGAMGLMQVMPATWRALALRHALGQDPYDARSNILAGTAYLREMLDRYGPQGFLAAYNAGPGRYEQYLFEGRALPAETRAYVTRIAAVIGGDLTPVSSASSAREQLARKPWTQSALFVNRAVAPESQAAGQAGSPDAPAIPPGESLFVARSASPAR